jgi:beta-N-acetylhexosaminidase
MHAPLFIDVAGLTLTKKDVRRLQHPLVGGLILFARNWQNREQLTQLCLSIKDVRDDLIISVDHEGGRVQRFKSDGFTVLPPMASLGRAWMMQDKAQQAHGHAAMTALNKATACGYVLGAELRACGVDLSFAPVLDLDYGASGVIGDRAFHSDPVVVTLLAKALMQGLLQSGMAHCGKHFPGHGYVIADSHVDIPIDTRSLTKILKADAAPYGWLSASLCGVMPAHVVYPKVDSKPAGFSSRWLNDILRSRLGFNGAIFSDDLSMAGARCVDGRQLDFTEAAVLALNAGCDLVLLCNQSVGDTSAIDALLDGLDQAQANLSWLPNPLSEERRQSLLPCTPALDWDSLMVSSNYMQALDLLI